MEEIGQAEEVESYEKFLSELLLFIQSIGKPVESVDSSSVPSEIEKLRQEYAELQQKQADVRWSLEEQIEVLEERLQSSRQVTSKKDAVPKQSGHMPEVTLRK